MKFDFGVNVNTQHMATTIDGLDFIPDKSSFRKFITMQFVDSNGVITDNQLTCIVSAGGRCQVTSARNLQQAIGGANVLKDFLTENGYHGAISNLSKFKALTSKLAPCHWNMWFIRIQDSYSITVRQWRLLIV